MLKDSHAFVLRLILAAFSSALVAGPVWANPAGVLVPNREYVLFHSPEDGIGRCLMAFSGERDKTDSFTRHASVGIVWSEDLKIWHWPGANPQGARPLR